MSAKNQEIDRRAAEWAAARDLRALSPAEEAEFAAWLEADTRHLGAYGRAQAVLARLERLSPASRSGLVPKDRVGSIPRRYVLLGAMAATIVIIVGLTAIVRVGERSQETVSTAIGQTKEVILDDGSIVLLNTNTLIRTSFTRAERRVELQNGEAIFDVAKNKHRPFIVLAGGATIRAVGTSFSVSRLRSRPIEVLVREGIVELQRRNSEAEAPVRTGASTKAIISEDAPVVTKSVSQSALADDLAWRKGRLAFENQTLEEAAKEYSRYTTIRILIDPSASKRTITGLFASNDPVGFAKVAAGLLNLQVEVQGNQVRIFEGAASQP